MAQPPAGRDAALYRVTVSPADVGARVVVRRRLPHPAPGEPPLGDVLGELVSWDGGTLVVRTRDGVDVPVSEHLVLAAKRVPPPPARRARS